jgi:hypothetical protein
VRTASIIRVIITLKIEAVRTSERLVYYETRRGNIPEGSTLLNILMFVMVTGCVLFDVRNVFLNII